METMHLRNPQLKLLRSPIILAKATSGTQSTCCIIQRAYAGTPIEGWMPWEIQKDDFRTKSHRQSIIDFAERRSRNQGESVDKAIKAFHQELSEYNSKVDAGETMKNAFDLLAPPIITPEHWDINIRLISTMQ